MTSLSIANPSRLIERVAAASPSRLTGYIAAPVDLYDSAHYERARASAFARWPDAQWIEPALCDWSFAQWLEQWPLILPTLDFLLAIPRLDLTIGRGCWLEIRDCQARSLPIWVWAHERWWQSFEFELEPDGDYHVWAKIGVHDEQRN